MNITCDLYRNPGEAWGFRLQGGSEYRSQLSVKKVTPGSPADRSLRGNDEIISINSVPTKNMSHRDAENMIRSSGNSLSLDVKRGDDPLANYRPEGPIKFNVQRANQVRMAMGIPAATVATSPVAGGYAPMINSGYGHPAYVPQQSPMVNGYGPSSAANGYAPVHLSQNAQPQEVAGGERAFPWNASVSMRSPPTHNIQYGNYY